MDSSVVLKIFEQITRIPRESGHEDGIRAWLTEWAESHSLEHRQDAAGNLLIRREAAPGKENVPVLVLQSHLDMVCEKNAGVEHDFAHDPIRYEIRDGWMVAPDTTLGADDGIGIAASLALLEDNTPTGALECLFTASEETGMDGAMGLEPGFFEGKTLVNLDSEDEGQLFVGCAGGLNTNIRFRVFRSALKCGYEPVGLMVGGGQGGHSGDDINKGRVNTVQQMARFLYAHLSECQVLSITGGGKPNAIARECSAIVAVPDIKAFASEVEKFSASLKEQFHKTDPEVFCRILARGEYDDAAAILPRPALSDSSALAVVRSLYTCPHGMQAMSQDIDGLVQTSTNLASVRMIGRGVVEVVTSQRSSSTAERRDIAARVAANFESEGAVTTKKYEYPGWNPDMSSPILARTVEAYRRLFSQEPEVKAIHAGLECGLFAEKIGGLDMISFGPTLRGVHAPGERLELASLDKFVALLYDIVVNFN
ncbi:MAG: beta-Ala-His dipeptidase [Bacteroidales bacterium]|nr:beta-Ala-His dipeptidase [Bacteroidales bacterium]